MTTNEDIEQAKEGLRLQRFWPHVEDIVIDAGKALAAIEELQSRYDMMTTLANVTADTSADRIDELLARIEELEQRNRALEVTLDRITQKENWEILIDMQIDQSKVRKAFKKVIKQLEDAVREVS
jgi:hypothetical protein